MSALFCSARTRSGKESGLEEDCKVWAIWHYSPHLVRKESCVVRVAVGVALLELLRNCNF